MYKAVFQCEKIRFAREITARRPGGMAEAACLGVGRAGGMAEAARLGARRVGGMENVGRLGVGRGEGMPDGMCS